MIVLYLMLSLIVDGMKLDSCDDDNGLLSALCENYHVCFDEVRCYAARG